ncbi:MAG: hypothetical protein K8W52_45445 [Deltaproteobacteria bacterium]|nr:hypothetical protein [Deltaproteobacteria bacterium]
MRGTLLVLIVGSLFLGCADDLNVGATCTATAGCDSGLTCDTTVSGGYCTQACSTPGEVGDCPDGAICDTVGATAMACVKICMIQSDCRDDQQCNGTTGGSTKACKPK